MRRITAAVAVVLLGLVACDSHTPPQTVRTPTATPTAAGSLCERLAPQLTGWKAAAADSGLIVPLGDGCSLVDAAQDSHRVRVTLSAAPVTDAQFAEFRKSDAERITELGYAAKVIDGEIGPGSWAVDPAAAGSWLVFRAGNRPIKLSVEDGGSGTLDELRSIAETILGLPGGLPTAQPIIARPECARGTAAAERLLGGQAVLRRDALADGYLSCQWGSATRSVVVRSGGLGSDPSLDFGYVKGGFHSHRVNVGIEGWQQTDGELVFRTAKDAYIELVATPGSTLHPGPVVALAQAIAPAYA
ncbi:hypothetical protein [Kribbella kalugense]|uniref:DUF3558 domain-containing protein n=1 Tax=Kribbella kalugense TaxID=2512221 RepID=A0A4R7ZWE1_9ACTN|nr:hypothetical protein [Kribbella kalugense]TDW21198.1 hypothetical protein EV650_0014 [Kribbella kalugense]